MTFFLSIMIQSMQKVFNGSMFDGSMMGQWFNVGCTIDISACGDPCWVYSNQNVSGQL